MSHLAVHHTGSGHDASSAALKGASLAFHRRQPSAPSSPIHRPVADKGHGHSHGHGANGGNAALTAATTSAALSRHSTGGSNGLPDMNHAASRNIVAARLHQLGQLQQQQQQQQQSPQYHQQQHLSPLNLHHHHAQNNSRIDTKSPSFIAATLAVSRSGSPSPMNRTPSRKPSAGGVSVESAGDPVDSGPIAPTGSLISMFETGRGEHHYRPRKRASPERWSGDVDAIQEEEPISPSTSVKSKQSVPSVSKRLERTPAPPKPSIQRNGQGAGDLSLRSPQSTNHGRSDEPALAPQGRPVASKKPDTPAKPLVAKQLPSPASAPSPKPKIKETPPSTTAVAAGHNADKPPLKASSQPLKPLAESQPRAKDKATNGGNVEATKPPLSSDLTRKPSKPPKPAVKPETSSAEKTPVRWVEAKSAPPAAPKPEPPATPTKVQQGQVEKPEKPKLQTRNLSSPQPEVVSTSQTAVLSPTPIRQNKPQLPPPTPPQHLKSTSRPSPSPVTSPQPSPGDPQKTDSPASQRKLQPPTPPKPRGSAVRITRTPVDQSTRSSPPRPKLTETARSKTSESEVFVSAPTSPEHSSPPPNPYPAPPRRLSAVHSGSSSRLSPHNNRRLTHSQSSHNIGLDSLTSAIMAGSLASSRLTPHHTGSSLPPPPPPPRTKSPRLRSTMRDTAHVSDDDEDKHHHRKGGMSRYKLRTGKHAHHEGSRKKWRDQIRPRERKRYEAIWASNRGLLLPANNPNQQQARRASPAPSIASGALDEGPDYENSIVDVVVREIWRRSRLPEDELAEVWNAVDRERRHMLGRAEFIVGMWLIDQRLRGRKIPNKVSDSVWGSANGLRVKGPKMK